MWLLMLKLYHYNNRKGKYNFNQILYRFLNYALLNELNIIFILCHAYNILINHT